MRRQLLPPARRRIKVIVNDRITAYIQSLDAGNGPLLDSIEEEALADCVPIIRRETSAFLKTLIALKRPQSILEVGTAVGYSALLMSRVMPENCRITTIEKYEKRIPIAKRNFERAGKEPCITLLEGDAEEILGTLSGPYDFIWMRLRGSICTGCLRFCVCCRPAAFFCRTMSYRTAISWNPAMRSSAATGRSTRGCAIIYMN